ncbi:3-phosphoshikimate 1-carboxyvinyltransferase [Cytobacillus gottheilii]|uniref:3-phosphoshikimate 1-carboxyvinyltransferase n=1 Tax=Cytobacillus gottheilii TaxID=859144 RepID=UPI0009B9AE8F|nr:3-phosphoshikimate 1-carboxyvinyltransferase [Cytobacillus gottheilii]
MKLVHDIPGLKGIVEVPGDKSISHRSIMFGAISKGETRVTNFLQGDDCLSTIACFKKLGVQIELHDDEVVIKGSGFDGLKEPEDILHVGNSGTTIRLMMGILAGRGFHSVLIGDESIAKRPMTRVTKPLQQFGASIQGRKNGEFTPISLKGGSLQGITYEMPMASAQVKSALLFAGLQAEGTTTIIEQARTRDHTEKMIMAFGGKVEVDGLKVSLQGGQELKATTVHVPGDISSAAFFLAAGAIVPNSKITLKNVGLNPTRTGILDVLSAMGANLQVAPYENGQAEPAGDLTIQTSALKGTVIDGALIPRLIDEIPIIALLASQAEGQTIIKDAEELKVKETNRIDTVVNELRKLGVKITATDDGMVVEGKSELSGGKVSSHGDHRIGMMLAIAAAISNEEVHLEEAEAISVSYPNFFEHLHSLIAE